LQLTCSPIPSQAVLLNNTASLSPSFISAALASSHASRRP